MFCVKNIKYKLSINTSESPIILVSVMGMPVKYWGILILVKGEMLYKLK